MTCFLFKELLAEFRQELDAAKREIIEGMSAAIEDFYVMPEQENRHVSLNRTEN